MDWVDMWLYVKEHLNWIIPSLTSLFFALVTTLLIIFQSKWQKKEKKRSTDFMAHQNELQQTQICIELLENRLKISSCIHDSLDRIAANNQVSPRDMSDLSQGTRGIEYLFGEDVTDYLNRIYETYNRIVLVQDELSGSEASSNQQIYEIKLKERFDLFAQFREYFLEFDSIFLSYYNFQGVHATVNKPKYK
ncbi:MAG: hypothetical protein LLF75_01135 [Eubacteriales bacterium]|nr:hypothetical protein [Eubacteriales bacterium]